MEANGVAAGIETLVLEDGACTVPRIKFLKILKTFHPKPNVTLEADESGLKIESFVMKATSFSAVAVAPGEFQVFPVTDTWLGKPEAAQPMPLSENRWLKSR